PVAIFLVEIECSQSITEALRMIKNWGAPEQTVFLIDHSLPELIALERVFPDSVVMFCDFHRAQAWYRWMRSNGSAKSSLRFLLQQVADAASYPDFIERCNALNESPDYSERARDWFTKHWLSHQQRWVRYWRLMVPHAPWTTNGVETLHHTLKTKFLAHYGDRSLQGFLFAVLTKYLPSMMKDYRAANLAITCARVFKGKMPDFLEEVHVIEGEKRTNNRQSSCFNAARMEIQRRQSVKNPAGYLVACRDGILLRDVELATVLKTDEWLSDADVNMFMHCAALQAPLLQIRVLECFAMRRLIEGKRLNARVLKNIQDVDLILGPILESGHWTLL
ncbi:hypothetical protein CAPTEDRAFT_192406, partial [Capitella teleta]